MLFTSAFYWAKHMPLLGGIYESFVPYLLTDASRTRERNALITCDDQHYSFAINIWPMNVYTLTYARG